MNDRREETTIAKRRKSVVFVVVVARNVRRGLVFAFHRRLDDVVTVERDNEIISRLSRLGSNTRRIRGGGAL